MDAADIKKLEKYSVKYQEHLKQQEEDIKNGVFNAIFKNIKSISNFEKGYETVFAVDDCHPLRVSRCAAAKEFYDKYKNHYLRFEGKSYSYECTLDVVWNNIPISSNNL